MMREMERDVTGDRISGRGKKKGMVVKGKSKEG